MAENLRLAPRYQRAITPPCRKERPQPQDEAGGFRAHSMYFRTLGSMRVRARRTQLRQTSMTSERGAEGGEGHKGWGEPPKYYTRINDWVRKSPHPKSGYIVGQKFMPTVPFP